LHLLAIIITFHYLTGFEAALAAAAALDAATQAVALEATVAAATLRILEVR
jgi:hypothetical protein